MTRISGPTAPRTAAGGAARTTRASGFSLSVEAGTGSIGGDAPVAPAAATAPPSAVLSLQEIDPPAPDQRRNQQARQSATAMLDLLGTLQHDLLGGGGTPATAAQLNDLLATQPAEDPTLAAIQRAIACRAAVELARRGDMPK